MPEAQPLVENQNSFVSLELRPRNSDCYMHLIAIFRMHPKNECSEDKRNRRNEQGLESPQHTSVNECTMSERERKRNCNKC
mmetsp:Transcript_3517/g.8462  ORF Transcript_3517/g.8462 Transcript_3517/m.8462 type:complete len:81 (-) Transcript_3517:93-335(-)